MVLPHVVAGAIGLSACRLDATADHCKKILKLHHRVTFSYTSSRIAIAVELGNRTGNTAYGDGQRGSGRNDSIVFVLHFCGVRALA